MSGVDIDGQSYRKGALCNHWSMQSKGGNAPYELKEKVKSIAKSGGTPLFCLP